MNEQLDSGFSVKTKLGGEVSAPQFLAEGGQGYVYRVLYNGQEKALKWYKPGSIQDENAFYDNVWQNVMRGSPSEEFLWPIDVTERRDGTFGYVMDLRPEGYYEVTDFMLCKARFRGYKTAIDAAMKIVSAFRKLHNAGYSYQDLNDGNFFINPQNGKVLICDNDNVAPDKMETGIVGKPRYMAPEIVLRKNMPDSLSDRFSMSVILYMLFCLNHPLEGKRYLIPGLTPEMQEKLYGSEPLFMMDPDDQSNGPHERVHANSVMVWNCLPEYMKKIFLDAFGQKALRRPPARPKEIDWLNALTRFRSDIVVCEKCGNEIFTCQGEPCPCDNCGATPHIPVKITLSGYSIPAVKDSRIYRCQLGVCNEKDALDPVARALEKKNAPGVLGLCNKTGKPGNAVTSKGAARRVAPDEVVPLKPGITLTAFEEPIKLEANGR